MKLEKLFYFPLLHKAALKKIRKVKTGFGDVATLHFQNYSGCDALVAERPVLSPELHSGSTPTWEVLGAAGGPGRPRWTEPTAPGGPLTGAHLAGGSTDGRCSKRSAPLTTLKRPRESRHLTPPLPARGGEDTPLPLCLGL